MRILALSPFLVVAALAAPVGADRRELLAPGRPAGQHEKVTEKVAALAPPASAGTSLTTGEIGLTGPARAARPVRLEPFLSATEISAEIRPYGAAIERCYLEHLGDARRAGHLDLTFVIGRDGSVVSLAAAAPGLPARTARLVEACIRDAAAALQFPPRRNDTTAIVPYYFQRTEAAGAGPQLSCWNPKGCPGR
ncbi:MAG TPA: hypothetical protein VGD37_17935 [Kofleriaceae bacterium]